MPSVPQTLEPENQALAAQFFFTLVSEGELLAEFELGPGVYVLGRASSCEISVDLEGLGEEHARLELG
ncbi:MAG TPA: FHA domain-containing protein, partial [Chthoniobacteraceae bacterium]